MATTEKLQKAYSLFDAANEKDPNKEEYQGKTYAKEVLYAIRMTNKLNAFAPNASEALQLTARCQHICRWEIPRSDYPMDRIGYLKWREELKKFHATKASEILEKVGYSSEIIDRVSFLIQKKKLKKDEDTQTLEDVICLVFLTFYYPEFSTKHPDGKVIDILQKTWRKMSDKGQKTALQLSHSGKALILLQEALS